MAIASNDIVADGYDTEARWPMQVHPFRDGYSVIYEGDERGCFKAPDDLTTEERELLTQESLTAVPNLRIVGDGPGPERDRPDRIILWPDEDTAEAVDYPGRWCPGERGRVWLATDRGSYTLIAGLHGTGKSRLAGEFLAREAESGGQPLIIAAEAVGSWRIRNQQLPTGSRIPIVLGSGLSLKRLRAALQAAHRAGRSWPTAVVVDPATELMPPWAGDAQGSPYSHPLVAKATDRLTVAITAPGEEPPALIYCVHTPEGEQRGRGQRSVAGYSQRAGVGYLTVKPGTIRGAQATARLPLPVGWALAISASRGRPTRPGQVRRRSRSDHPPRRGEPRPTG